MIYENEETNESAGADIAVREHVTRPAISSPNSPSDIVTVTERSDDVAPPIVLRNSDRDPIAASSNDGGGGGREDVLHGTNIVTPSVSGKPDESSFVGEQTPTATTSTALVIVPAAAPAPLEVQAEIVYPRGSIEHALNEVSAYESSIDTIAVVARSLSVTNAELVAGDASLTVSRRSFAALCETVQAPSAYLHQLPPELQRDVLKHHLTLSFGDGERVYVLARDEGFIGLRDPKLLALRATDVLHVTAEAIGAAPFRVAGLRWPTPTTIEFELVMPGIAAEVAVGDIVQAGVRIAHSIVGAHATWVSAYVVRLVCMNGLTARQCVSAPTTGGQRQLGPRTRRLPANLPHARESQLEQVRRLVVREVEALDVKLGGLAGLTTERTNVEALFAGFLQRAHLPHSLLPILRAAWTTEGGAPTRWAAVNALTRVATHDRGLSPRVRRALAALGGLVAFEADHLCPLCFRHVAGPVGADDAEDHHRHMS